MKNETIKTTEAEIERVYGKELAAAKAGVIHSKTIQERIVEGMRLARGHNLKIHSLHDALASCSCGRWSYRAPGKVSRDHIEAEHRNHEAQHSENS